MFCQNDLEKGVLNVVGPRLRELRTARRITQSELCFMAKEKHLTISVATICKIERQQRSVYDYEVRIFAEILDVSIDELYCDF